MKKYMQAHVLGRFLIGCAGFAIAVAMLTPMETQSAWRSWVGKKKTKNRMPITKKTLMLQDALKSCQEMNAGPINEIVSTYGVDVVDEYGRGLLHYACKSVGDAVYFVLIYNPNINIVDNNGETPLMRAVRANNIGAVRALIDHDNGRAAVDSINGQAREPMDIEKINEEGDTALLIALRLGHFEIANFLIESGASVKACNAITRASVLTVLREYSNAHSGGRKDPDVLEMKAILHERGIDVIGYEACRMFDLARQPSPASYSHAAQYPVRPTHARDGVERKAKRSVASASCGDAAGGTSRKIAWASETRACPSCIFENQPGVLRCEECGHVFIPD